MGRERILRLAAREDVLRICRRGILIRRQIVNVFLPFKTQ